MKHTPGPWTTNKQRAPNGGTYYRIQEQNSQDNDCIAQCGPWMASKDGYEALGNARLIAAAPELLEALRYFVDKNTDAEPADDSELVRWNAQINIARAAIAKAEGTEES